MFKFKTSLIVSYLFNIVFLPFFPERLVSFSERYNTCENTLLILKSINKIQFCMRSVCFAQYMSLQCPSESTQYEIMRLITEEMFVAFSSALEVSLIQNLFHKCMTKSSSALVTCCIVFILIKQWYVIIYRL